MKMRPKRKMLLLALAVCIVFPIFFTETLIVEELDHYCCVKEEENDCRPCLRILAAECFLTTLRLTVIISPSPLLQSSLVQTPEKYSGFNFYHLSPIGLKVRFNT